MSTRHEQRQKTMACESVGLDWCLRCMCFKHSSKCQAGSVGLRSSIETNWKQESWNLIHSLGARERHKLANSPSIVFFARQRVLPWRLRGRLGRSSFARFGKLQAKLLWRSRLHVSILPKNVTSSGFDATTGMCKLFRSSDNYTTYRKVLDIRTKIKQRQRPKCYWGASCLEMGRRCSSHFGTNWRNISKDLVLKTCESTSQCKGVHWFHKKSQDFDSISFGWFSLCMMWIWATQPGVLLSSDSSPLTKVSHVKSLAKLQVGCRGLRENVGKVANSVEAVVVSAFNKALDEPKSPC